MALECAPLFFFVSAIALPFLECVDLAGARCLCLDDFVGLRFLPLEGDFSSGRIGFLRFVGIVPFHLLQLLRAEVRLSGMRNKAQLTKGGALSDRSGCGGCVFYGGWKVMQGG